MTTFRFANRISALVTATVNSNDTTVALEAGTGTLLPVLGTDEIFRGTLIAATGAVEIINITEVVGDVITVQRGQEGTPAQTFPAGSRFELRMTAAIAESFLQKTGGTMTGPLDMAGNALLRASFSGATLFSTLHATFIRAGSTPLDQTYVTSENAIVIPPNVNANFDARRPGYMGRVITNAQMFDGVVFQWFGDVNNPPSHLKLCDGTQGTPDLRGKFVRGWMPTYGVGGEGGVPVDFGSPTVSNTTSGPGGTHSHTTGGTLIGRANLAGDVVVDFNFPIGAPSNIGFDPNNINRRIDKVFGGNQAHGHSVSQAPDHGHAVNILPPFYCLAFVMFKV